MLETQTSIEVGVVNQASRSRIFLKIGIFVLIVLIAYSGYVYFYQQRGQYTRAEKQALETAIMKPETFASNNYQKYISEVDKQVANNSLSEGVKNKILYNKAIVLMDAFEPNQKLRDQSRIEAGGILRNLYDSTTTGILKESVILAYLLDFNQRFFLNGDTRLLPISYSAPYFELYNASSTRNVTINDFQKLAFQTFIKLSYDPLVTTFKGDTTFISNRMYLTAIYLDSFGYQMTDNEKDTLLALLNNDIKTYQSTRGISFQDIRHTKLIADFYYAYANDVYVQKSSPKDVYAEAKKVQTLYEKARSNVQLNGVLSETNLNMGQYIDTYYLAFLWNTPLKVGSPKIKEVISELDNYSNNKSNDGSIKSFYTDFLNTRGSWMDIKRSLVKVDGYFKEYSTYLDKMGVTLK